MAVFNGYFDTGGFQGDQEGTILITFGVVATVEKWEKFDKRWKAVLAEYGVTELHMREFAHSRGEFAGWKGDEERRKEFLAALTHEAKRGLNKAFGVAVVLPDYRTVDREHCMTEQLGGPYSVAQSICLVSANEWLRETKGGHHRVEYFVAHGDAGQDAFLKFIHEQMGNKPTILSRKNTAGEPYSPFQVADFLAYEHRYLYDHFVKTGAVGKVRGSFNELRRMIPVDVGIFDQKAMRAWCEHSKIARRQ